jgi:hypothetical protein
MAFFSSHNSLSRPEQTVDSDWWLTGLCEVLPGSKQAGIWGRGLSQVIFFKLVFEKPRNQIWLVSYCSRECGCD